MDWNGSLRVVQGVGDGTAIHADARRGSVQSVEAEIRHVAPTKKNVVNIVFLRYKGL
jgi:hypothetical protein